MIHKRSVNLSGIIIMLAVSVLFMGCSGGGGPIDPGMTPDVELTGQIDPVSQHNGTVLWGLWDICADSTSGDLTITPLRGPAFQANVTRFLQPPDSPINMLSILIDIPDSDIPNGLIACDLSIQHPFPRTQLWGFDVRGIVMGSPAGDVQLINHDGYTRWWNPVEFTTVETIFGYTEGAFAPPGDTPETILHPYKYFADSLGPNDKMEIDPATRGVFNPGNMGTLKRRYELQFPTPGGIPDFHFKYAITASWEAPVSVAPWVLSDFPIGANQAEAYQISVLDVGSTLYNDGTNFGGDLELKVTVYDWQKPYNPDGMSGELAALIVESDALELPPTDILFSAVATSGPDFNSTSYQFTIPDLSPVTAGWVDLWVTAESATVTTYKPDIPGISGFDYPEDAVLSAYNRANIEVLDEAQPQIVTIHVIEPNGGEEWGVGTEYDIVWETTGTIPTVIIEYRLSDTTDWIEIIPSTDNDGEFEWTIPDTLTETARVRVSYTADPEVNDISDEYFAIVQTPKTIHVIEPNGGEVWEVGSEHDIEWESTGEIPLVKIEYSITGDEPWIEIIPSTENDFVFEWIIPDTPTDTARVRVSDVTQSEVNDISDCVFHIIPVDTVIYVDDSSTSPDEFGTMDDPFKTIGAALAVATDGDIILVDDSGNTYNESVGLADGVMIFSDNWDISDGGARASIMTPDIPGMSTVRADGVTNATISGFNVRPGGSYSTDYEFFVTMIYLSNCSNITIADCYFNSEELPRHIAGVYIEASSDIEICCSQFEHMHGPDPLLDTIAETIMCIYAENTPNMYIHNVRMNDIGLNFNNIAHNIYVCNLVYCDNAVLHNNLIYHVQIVSDGQGAALAESFKLEYCDSPVLYNNTVNFLDTVENFFINQAFCYFFRECPDGVFYNNMAANVTESGWAPDGSSLGRGIQSYLYDLPCDYTLTWNIEAPYFQQAYPNIGCVEEQPLFIDPENGLHDIEYGSPAQLGDPSFVDWDDTGTPSGDPGNPDPNTRSRMGCHGGPGGSLVGLSTPE